MAARVLPDIRSVIDPLIGLPYAQFQMRHVAEGQDACWGLVHYLLREGLGLDLEEDPASASAQLAEIWGPGDPRDPLSLVQPWDGYILAVKHAWSDHVGLVVDATSFVHVRVPTGVCIERLRRWRPRLFQVARLRSLM